MTAKRNAILLADWLLRLADYVRPQCTGDNISYYTPFENLAVEAGFSLLGMGHFSDVFSHPQAPGYVIKVSVRDNDASPAYMAWCRSNPGPHIPRIHYLKRHLKYTVAVLDRLYEMDREAHGVYRDNLNYTLTTITDHPVSIVAQRIRKFFENACDLDLHAKNCMMDKNKQLVLTDPVSFRTSREPRAETGVHFRYRF